MKDLSEFPNDWRDLTDEQFDAVMKERERRRRERPSPFPWTATTLMVVDADGRGVAHCGAYGTPEQGIANVRVLACGPDGLELALQIIDCVNNQKSMLAPLEAAKALVFKADIQ